MKNYSLLFVACFFVSGCTRNTGNTSEQQLKADIFRLQQENDSLKRVLARNDTILKADTISKTPVESEPGVSPVSISGKHALTLQWISWDNPGSVMITEDKNGWYKITGQQVDQKNRQNYLKINGRIRPVSSTELEFDGTIETKVESINSGKPCLRTGTKIFKATGTRKYWRLQDMINCEGGMVTDYVDIYF